VPLSKDPVEQARKHWVDHGWSSAADGMAAVTSLMRAQQIVLGRVESVLKRYDITFARYEVLMLLVFSKHGSLPMRVIGQRLQVHPTSVTNAVDRLEGAELVRRVPHPTDRRATLIELTGSGRRMALEATEALNVEVFADLMLSPGLVGELRELRAAAGDFSV
jgi:DNA-binding MarR family transcriptional regulator